MLGRRSPQICFPRLPLIFIIHRIQSKNLWMHLKFHLQISSAVTLLQSKMKYTDANRTTLQFKGFGWRILGLVHQYFRLIGRERPQTLFRRFLEASLFLYRSYTTWVTLTSCIQFVLNFFTTYLASIIIIIPFFIKVIGPILPSI
jgi:hypothetical protein